MLTYKSIKEAPHSDYGKTEKKNQIEYQRIKQNVDIDFTKRKSGKEYTKTLE